MRKLDRGAAKVNSAPNLINFLFFMFPAGSLNIARKATIEYGNQVIGTAATMMAPCFIAFSCTNNFVEKKNIHTLI